MYPTHHYVRYWGCKCCTPGQSAGGKTHNNWNVYKLSGGGSDGAAPAAAKATKLYSNKECGASRYLGKTFSTPDKCAESAAKNSACGDAIMYPKGSLWSNWGCRCCTRGRTAGGKTHSSWDVYKISKGGSSASSSS